MPVHEESVTSIGDLIRAGKSLRKRFKPEDDEREEVVVPRAVRRRTAFVADTV